MGIKSGEQGRHSVWSIAIWVEDPHRHPQMWAGQLRTNTGQRFPFRSLAELDRLLCELGGWIDPADQLPSPSGSGPAAPDGSDSPTVPCESA